MPRRLTEFWMGLDNPSVCARADRAGERRQHLQASRHTQADGEAQGATNLAGDALQRRGMKGGSVSAFKPKPMKYP